MERSFYQGVIVDLLERELRRRTCASREVWKRKGVAAEAWLKF
jgi:hypothetical protein